MRPHPFDVTVCGQRVFLAVAIGFQLATLIVGLVAVGVVR